MSVNYLHLLPGDTHLVEVRRRRIVERRCEGGGRRGRGSTEGGRERKGRMKRRDVKDVRVMEERKNYDEQYVGERNWGIMEGRRKEEERQERYV